MRFPVLLAALLFAVGLASAQPASEAALAEADRLAAASDSLTEAGAYAEAEDAAREALRLTEDAVGPDDPRVADRLSALAWLLEGGGDLAGAEPLYARALSIAEAAPGQPDLGDHLINLGLARQGLGYHERANPLFRRAVAAYEAVGDPVAAAEAHYNLALGLFYLGAFAEARPHYETTLATFEEVLGTDHPNLAYPLTGLARLDHQRGDYAAARSSYERAVRLRESALGPDHPAVANDRNELGWLLIDIGDYAEAERVSERAVAATDSVRGAEAVATRALYNLGVARARMGRTAEAESAYGRALAIREATLGPDHPGVAQLLAEQGALAERAGDAERARDLYRRAAAIRSAALGTDHPNVAATLDRLAWTNARLGAADSAVVHARRALAIWEGSLPDGHPSIATSEAGLAEIYLATGAGTADDVERLLLRSSAALTAHARMTLADLAWAEQRAFLDATLRRQTGTVLTAFQDSPSLAEAYADVAGWKGLLLHGLRRQTALARLEGSEHAGDVEALAAVRADLAGWFQRAGTLPLAAWQARNDSLNAQKESLERSLAATLPPGALSDPLADLLAGGGAAALAARLPPNTAFVDVYLYGRRVSVDSLVSSYGAFVLDRDGLSFVPLGPASEVDATIDGWRRAVVRGGSGEEDWTRLARQIWSPVAAMLPDGLTGVWTSPDGLLGRIPWSLLPAHGGPSVSVVDSARELVYTLDRDAPDPRARVVLAVGDVDFGEGYRFEPLPATAREVSLLREVARSQAARVVTLTGSEATVEEVREQLPHATHVHLATHGVFMDDSAPGGAEGHWARSPLVESGLAFAGANDGADGVLTAETLIGIDQSGTDLVVLSACETGLGTEVDGQGVMGLRAAFTTAGAGSVLMSLWQVPDESTATLMRHVYEGIWDRGLSVAEALQSAQAAVRADRETAAPVHWAGWMVVGRAW